MKWQSIFVAVLVFGLSWRAYAALLIYDSGPGLVYDTVYDITWLRNTNYVETTGYDDLFYGYDTGGRLTWYDAVDWVSNLSIHDTSNNITWDDFRLPTYDGAYGFHADGIGSEFAHLYYSELGNIVDSIEGMEKQGPFNVMGQTYWTDVTHYENKVYAGMFTINWGDHTYAMKVDKRHVWPVMDGDAAAEAGLQPTPIPAPIVDAGGPYFLDPGGPPIMLEGSVVGEYSQAAWDLNSDWLFDDAFGLNPLISSVMLTSLGFSLGMTRDIGLQVTALDGRIDIDTTQLTLTPVPSAVILGSLGLTFSGWLLRKRRML